MITLPKQAAVIAAIFIMVALLTNGASAAEEYAVFKSTDRGRSWVHSDAGMPQKSRINAFGSLDDAVFAGTDSGIFISTDEARTWQTATGLAASSGRILCFAALGRKVFAGTDGKGMLASSDRGISWLSTPASPSRKVRCLLAHGGKLYAGTDADGVFASNEDGTAWTRLSPRFPAHAQVFALSMVDGRLFAGLYSKGVYAWSERENRWTQAGPISPLALATIGGVLIAGRNPGGLHWSEDMGTTWSKGTANSATQFAPFLPDDSGELAAEAPVWDLASNEGLLFAGASAGIYYSEDRGRTWIRARTGLPEKSAGISFLLKPNFVLAGTWITRRAESTTGVTAERR